MELIKFELLDRNSCSECTKIMQAGENVYAKNKDEVLAGLGICTECAKPPKPAPVKPLK